MYTVVIDKCTSRERKYYFKDKDCKIIHKEDGPAVEWKNGTKEWWIDNKLNRAEGPAILWNIGAKEWYKNGERHREGGPAIDAGDEKEWYINGKRHREDGPAVKHRRGYKEYWLNGLFYSNKEEYIKEVLFLQASRRFGDFV